MQAMRQVALAAILAMCTMLACAEPQEGPPGRLVKSDKQRISDPTVLPADLQRQVLANADFALDLYRAIDAEQGGEILISPYSISHALAMTWAGARTETEAEMAATLRFGFEQAALHPIFNRLNLDLDGRDQEGLQLDIVATTFAQEGWDFLPAFLDTLALHYDAGVYLVDFRSAHEQARQRINAWVADETAQRIDELLPPGALDEKTVMTLVNAIYFKGQWANAFLPENTRQRAFNLLDGSQVNVPTMEHRALLRMARTEAYDAVELDYKGEQLAMLIISPSQGTLTDFEQSLTGAELQEIADALERRDIYLQLPKWSSAAPSFSIADKLAEMGMPCAFSPPCADLSGMDGSDRLYIQDAFHQTFVAVDEEGTEAAGATAVVIGYESGPMDLHINRPFLYAIRDRDSGALLFLGRVLDPSA